MICIIIYCTVYDCIYYIALYTYVHMIIPFDGVALSCPLSCEHHSLLKLKHLQIHVKFIMHCVDGFHICSTYVQCVWEECEGITVYSLILKSGKLELDMHLRLHEQLYVKFQFYTAHYTVDYSSMLCTLCTHKLHILALSLTSDCSPGLLDRAVYNTICCNYAIRSYANCVFPVAPGVGTNVHTM